jgi:hypothetical protein
MCCRKGNEVSPSHLCPDMTNRRGADESSREKPWSHTTTFEKPNWRQEGKGSQFGDTARGNEVMKPFD